MPETTNPTPQQEVARAEDAARVLESPAFQEALAAVKADILGQLIACPVRDVEGLQLLQQAYRLSEKVAEALRGYLESGKLAQHQIEIDAERRQDRPSRGTIRTLR